jgi:flavorubredoxin
MTPNVEAKARMTKTILIYESKYGNTKIVAERIMQGLKTKKGMEADLKELKEVDTNKIPSYDVIMIGSPNHMGGPTRGIKKFIHKLGKLDLKKKQVAVFDTCSGDKALGQAVMKMEKSIAEKAPGLKILSSGLSIRVKGMKGPIVEEDLPKCEEFGRAIASKIS